jgi:cyanate lyase
MLNEAPMRGEGAVMPPTDPLIYRSYELVMVNGAGLESADRGGVRRRHHVSGRLRPVMERLADPEGDRVKITLSGKFLPFKYYGAKGNEQGLGYKER